MTLEWSPPVPQWRTYGPDERPCLGGCGARTRAEDRMCSTCRQLHSGAYKPRPINDDYWHGLGAGEWVQRGGIKVWKPRVTSVALGRFTCDNGGTTKDGPRPAALTAGSSQGLADYALRSVD